MSKITAKEIREDIARSRAYAKKSDYLRTLASLANAMKGLLTSQIFGAEKFEIHAHLDEALRDLNKMKMIRKLFPAGLKYQKGKEKAFYQTLMRLHKKLESAMEKARVTKLRKRLAVLDDNMIKAASLVKADQQLEARKLFRKISEYFQDIEGIDSDIGNRLTTFGMFAEAVEYLTKAIEVQQNDVRAHNALIQCYEGMNEVDKAMAAVKDAMRYVGASENLYLRMAKLHLTKREWSEVYNNAKAALDKNPLNAEASKLMKQAEPRIFAKTGTAKTAKKADGGAKKAHDLSF
ncbi:tetratricopeptide repeat protein [Pseudodesulfovibrio sp. zrk46]|uniref:tetratricopeptide repeat protein n=1 Tax=Pseudodesulfovibrio sp. zrk46 TaxID=2725288 RepID=UPI001448DAB0|nr:tetratricopeptide repeat protein [Pseudodesulfovibrio sp. zrk46]QJB55099.1 tetratricopeptide repeat protein [Pseudodesulfovibrio sp. zrk46]